MEAFNRFHIRYRQPNGIEGHVGPSVTIYPKRKLNIKVELEIPLDLMPRDEALWSAVVAHQLHEISLVILNEEKGPPDATPILPPA